MIKDLIKVANKLDSLGLTKEADFLDSIINKNAGLYKSKMEGSRWPDNYSDHWFNKDIFFSLNEKDIASDYLIKKYNLRVVKTPDEYIQFMEVQPWQEEKVRRAIENNPRSENFMPFIPAMDPESESTSFSTTAKRPVGDVTSEQLIKLLVADKDTEDPRYKDYKMDSNLFKRIKSGNDLGYQDLNDLELKILGI